MIKFSLILLLFFLSSLVFADNVVRVMLPEEIQVERKEIWLGDVAFISGGEKEVSDQLKGVSLGASPLPGNPRSITYQSVLLRIEREGIDLLKVQLEAPERMQIKSFFPLLDVEILREIVEDHLRQKMDLSLGWLEVTYLQGADNVYYPQGDLKIILSRPLDDLRRYLGQSTIAMEILVDGERWRQIYPRFSIDILTLVPVLKENLRRNQIITKDLVDIKLLSLSKVPTDYIEDEERIFGLRLKRNMSAGEAFRESYLEEVPLVERGDRVQVVVILGSIRISMLGEARGTGLYGDMIQIRNLDSNNLLVGKIIGPGLVQIEMEGI